MPPFQPSIVGICETDWTRHQYMRTGLSKSSPAPKQTYAKLVPALADGCAVLDLLEANDAPLALFLA